MVGTFPIGIDFEAFERDAKRPEIAAHAAELRRRVSDDVLVLGVDRLDYTKGIPERLKSFRLLLRRFPEMRGHITLVQVVVPSREEIPNYKHLRREVELLVSQINGEFTEPGWVPVHYIHRNLGRDELLAYYRAADIGLVTPLKDGMNLVAKEFCAAQIDERGVLIVSEFAGAGPELRSGAIIVNPNDFAEVAQALYDAAHMSADDKRCRMRLLRQIVKDHNVHRWIRSFLQAIPVRCPDKRRTRRRFVGAGCQIESTAAKHNAGRGPGGCSSFPSQSSAVCDGQGCQTSRAGQRRGRRLILRIVIVSEEGPFARRSKLLAQDDKWFAIRIVTPAVCLSSPATVSPPGTPAETTHRTSRTPNSGPLPVPRARLRRARSNSWCVRRCR